MRIAFLLFLLFSGICSEAQTIKSPDEFLGYPLGSKFTPHHLIVDYFKYVAGVTPQRVRLQQYGATYEGRPLYVAMVSAEENMGRIEEIRQNNLRRTGLLRDAKADNSLPVIVWLSFNVHGNEASSSEVSMKTLYELASGRDNRVNGWLKNELVIIDPCLNPDGHDRYVNWYNQVMGRYPNANPAAREHSEPWPTGRTNHYNFDLNRDWVWQSQQETQGRMKVYNQWMPEIHCDFHEQYPGNPYYFAPAAEPMHDVITPWQRSFQFTMGKNHAKYFDQQGWLYFTREIFDLFYPSYGDTYPLYNGAIGVTYEQAGHGRAGLAIQVNDDTLTLSQRIAHHFTTAMSTLEIASSNAGKLASEFEKYFADGMANGNGQYKSYLFKGDNPGKISEICELFKNNNIRFENAKPGQLIKAYDYFLNKEVSYQTSGADVVVSALQPKSALIRVLLEPQSHLSDTLTYDITAWALPYAFGIRGYASKELISGWPVKAAPENQVEENQYAYLVRYRSFEDARFLAAALKAGIRIRFAEKDFSFGGVDYARGTLVILKSGNENKIGKVTALAKQYNVDIASVNSGLMESGFDFGSEKLRMLKLPKVALVTGSGTAENAAGEVWHLFDEQLNFPVTLINSEDFRYADLKNFDVIILPDGNYSFLTDKSASADLKSWVRQGGKIIALENAVENMAAGDWGITNKRTMEKKKEDDNDKPSYSDIKRFENRERDQVVNYVPGAIYRVELDNSHPLAFGYENNYFSLKMNGNIYEFMKDGWNVGVFKKANHVSGFVGSKVNEKLMDGTVIAVQEMDKGQLVYFADDPIFRSFWQNGKLMFSNAVFFVGQ